MGKLTAGAVEPRKIKALGGKSAEGNEGAVSGRLSHERKLSKAVGGNADKKKPPLGRPCIGG